MKRTLFVLLTVLIACGLAAGGIEILENGDFEGGEPSGQFSEWNQNYPLSWSGWGYSGWHVTVSGNEADAPYILDERAVTMWAGDSGLNQPKAAAEGDFFVFSGMVNHPAQDPFGTTGPNEGVLTTDRYGILRVEFYTGPWPAGQLISTVEIGRTNGDDPSETWMEFSGIAQAPEGTGEVRFIAAVHDEPGGVHDGKLYFDNLSVIVPGPRDATGMMPAYDAALGTNLDMLTWTPPEPNIPGDAIICDVWICAEEPNFVPDDPRAAKFTGKIDSVSLITEEYALVEDTDYFWRVDCYDPSVGTTEGFVWKFNTGDRPPVATAGSDQYVWIDMNDSDGDDSKVTVTLAGDVDDDNKSDLETLWSLNYSEAAEGTNVIIANDEAQETTVTIDNTGWFQFLLTADDDSGHSESIVHVGVYSSACEAAIADPLDKYNSYADGMHGDINGDCATDLKDIAIIASTWLDCMSEKLDCQL